MNGRENIDRQLCFCTLIKIRVGHIHPVLDARIIDQYVQIGMLFGDPVIQIFPLRLDLQIAGPCHDCREPLRNFPEQVFAPAADDHGISFPYETLSQSQTDTARATGDQDFIVG